MANLNMPPAREFGWDLKPIESARFAIHQRANGQFCVVLNHALLRGVTAEMLHWWFLNFTNLRVTLEDIPGYEGKTVPAYLLWHPSDHLDASLSGNLGPGGVAQPGASIEIKEAMQYLKFGWKYPVNNKLRIFYCGCDGWAMGKQIPFFGPVMMLRIHFRDVFENDVCLGVHYHYEIVIGVSSASILGRVINDRVKAHFSEEFFEAWQTHNIVEVGTFENFLPSLFAQREQGNQLHYEKGLNNAPSVAGQSGFDEVLFAERLEGYKRATDPHEYQGFLRPSFLS
ncbi:MAG: hypothetical protein AAGC91_08155 [Pseudomonadota bacterium]